MSCAALTIDDATPEVLRVHEALRGRGVGATFFLDAQGLAAVGRDNLRGIAKAHEIGSHTVSHADLTKLPDDRIMEELTNSKRALEEAAGVDVTSFAYPYGKYDERVKGLVKASGYALARTVDEVGAVKEADPMAVPVTITDYSEEADPYGKMARVVKGLVGAGEGAIVLVLHGHRIAKYSAWDKFIYIVDFLINNKIKFILFRELKDCIKLWY
ncbi:MAG: polysaccharide deacetylase family protein [Thermoproteus sp. AZ2]|jgi:peptidoglycan/xylan/chitin deacetylase (PgdA/CDA1 family)|uniref:Polysaccharide deacetylase family protein n=1 Tax=Thermoproteus sp. AZ2 TaxID=1609232 RepID=A0ACC6V2S5_9CREN